MSGSGLKELLSTIYAEHSAEKMLNGHAYARAIRAHILCHQAIANIVWHSVDLTEEERTDLGVILNDIDRSAVLVVDNNECYKSVARKFKERLAQLEAYGLTAVSYTHLDVYKRQNIITLCS